MMNAKEPLIHCLEPDESVAQLSANGRALAAGVSYHKRYKSGVSAAEAMQFRACVILFIEGATPIRTSYRVGSVRALQAMSSGFLAALVRYDKNSHVATDFFEVNLNGRVTEMPSLEIDLVGVWISETGEIFSYSSRDVFRWTVTGSAWEKLTLNSAVSNEAIRKIVVLKDSSLLIVTDRGIKGFKNIYDAPVFERELSNYSGPVRAYGEDHWWIVTSDGHTNKIIIIGAEGGVQEVATLRVVNPHDLLFSGDRVYIVCAREGGDVHKYSYYIMNRDGSGKLSGPFMLPDDTMSACIWNDAIVTGGATNYIYKTKIEKP